MVGSENPPEDLPDFADGFSDGADEQKAVALGSDVAQFLR